MILIVFVIKNIKKMRTCRRSFHHRLRRRLHGSRLPGIVNNIISQNPNNKLCCVKKNQVETNY